MRRSAVGALAILALVGATAAGVLLTQAPAPGRADSSPLAVAGQASPSAPTAAPSLAPTVTSGPTPPPTPTPVPTPTLVASALDGLPTTPALAARHPIFVMVDDNWAARPQSGFTSASVVWQAPAEGGIPRYMLAFQEGDPTSVGPVRSARYYFVAWAAEWAGLYVHVGGSPQALQALAAQGNGRLVYNADEFNWGGARGYLWRVTTRFAPHNVYTDGAHLEALAARVGATSPAPTPAWQFGQVAPLNERPVGGTLSLSYPANAISYAYDRTTNTYLRSTDGQPQIDAANNRRVAPTNVVVMSMAFGPLNDGNPKKGRLEADFIGSGQAIVATNGRTVTGTWRKASLTGPTQFFAADGSPIVLTPGQTFVQVVPVGTAITWHDGPLPLPTTPSRSGGLLGG